MEFTYVEYEKLINNIKENGFVFTDYHNYSMYDKPCILRHDVDNSLEKAVEFARLEHKLGVVSTYFILLSTNFYNIASKSSIDQINEIISYGHKIGLHFDEVKYSELKELSVPKLIKKEANIMANILDANIETVSMHRPSKKTLDSNYKIEGVINSYDKIFFDDFKYISDSRRYWRENPLEIIKKVKKLHLLTHPFWYNEEGLNIFESVSAFVNSQNRMCYLNFEDNIRDMSEIMLIEEVK